MTCGFCSQAGFPRQPGGQANTLARRLNVFLGRAQLRLLQTLDKIHKALRLFAQAFEQFGIVQPSVFVQQGIDLRQENAFRKNVGVAIAENGLQLLDGPQRAPDSRGESRETNGTMLEALGKFQHVHEILEHAGNAAVVFGRDDVQAGRLQNRFGERLK